MGPAPKRRCGPRMISEAAGHASSAGCDVARGGHSKWRPTPLIQYPAVVPESSGRVSTSWSRRFWPQSYHGAQVCEARARWRGQTAINALPSNTCKTYPAAEAHQARHRVVGCERGLLMSAELTQISILNRRSGFSGGQHENLASRCIRWWSGTTGHNRFFASTCS
ncbi:hypothetical protein CHELA1G11_13240 [Hyphomicrobiales bacterium]|nr:hypothetical protein CHELA1G11_13240 [Hyphomicrobiales bacterium]